MSAGLKSKPGLKLAHMPGSAWAHEWHCDQAIVWHEVVAESIEAAGVLKGDLSRRVMGIVIARSTKGPFVILITNSEARNASTGEETTC